MLAILLGIAISLLKSFILPISTPNPGCICPARMMTPIAAIIPWTTEEGIKSAKPPSLNIPKMACNTPAQINAASICSQAPKTPIPETTIPIRAGDGPLMDTFPLRIIEVNTPPTIAAKIPASKASGGKFIAIAIPRDKGSATRETLKPARTSFLQYCLMLFMVFFTADNFII